MARIYLQAPIAIRFATCEKASTNKEPVAVSLPVPTVDELRKSLDCDPITGAIVWRTRSPESFLKSSGSSRWNSAFAGKPAFATKSSQGYLVGAYNYRQIKAHRVVWAFAHGRWPDRIDHINGIRDDNRIANLREATNAENGRNCKRRGDNSTGVAGVSWNKDVRKFRAFIQSDGRRTYLGAFPTLAGAAKARRDAEAVHGFHPNHGRDA